MLAGARDRLAREPRLAQRIELVQGQAEHLRLGERRVRPFDLHVPAALRGRSRGDPRRAGPRGQAGRADRVARVRPPRPATVAGAVAALHAGRPAGARGPCSVATGTRWAASWARASSSFYERWPLERQLELWKEAGISPVRQRRMSLGGGVVIWGVRVRLRARVARLLRAPPRRLARPGHAPPSSVHGLASELRRVRRRRGARVPCGAPVGGAGRLLPRRRGCVARARRAPGAPASDPSLSDRTSRRWPRRRLPGRSRSASPGCSSSPPRLAPFVVVGAFLIVLAYNLELFGGRFHTDFWFAVAWGAFPALTGFWVNGARHPLVRARRSPASS